MPLRSFNGSLGRNYLPPASHLPSAPKPQFSFSTCAFFSGERPRTCKPHLFSNPDPSTPTTSPPISEKECRSISMDPVGSPLANPSVDANLGGEGGEEFISNTKLTPFNPVVRYLKGAFDAGKHASLVQMIPTTKSHKFSSFLPILTLLQILGACHHLGQVVEWKQLRIVKLGLVEIRKMSQLVIWSSGAVEQLHERAQKSPQNCKTSISLTTHHL